MLKALYSHNNISTKYSVNQNYDMSIVWIKVYKRYEYEMGIGRGKRAKFFFHNGISIHAA